MSKNNTIKKKKISNLSFQWLYPAHGYITVDLCVLMPGGLFHLERFDQTWYKKKKKNHPPKKKEEKKKKKFYKILISKGKESWTFWGEHLCDRTV